MNPSKAEAVREIAAKLSGQAPEPEATIAAPVPAEEIPEEAQENAADDGGDQGVAEIRTIKDLAKSLDIDPGVLYDLEVGLADGEAPVKLGALKDLYQNVRRESESSKKALAEREQQMREVQAAIQQYQAAGSQVNAEMIGALTSLQSIGQQYQQVNWGELERDDPARAALLRQKFQEANAQAQSAFANAQARQGVFQQQARQAMLMRERDLLMQAAEEFRDPEKAKESVAGIAQAAQEFGFTPRELSMLADSRAVLLLREFTRMRKQLAEISKAEETVKKAPAAPASGGTLRAGQLSRQKVTALAQKAKQTGDRRDKIAAVNAILDRARIR